MKRLLILILAGVNVALLVILLLGVGMPEAEAQVGGGRGQGRFAVVTARINDTEEVLFVVDTARQQMLAWRFRGGGEFTRYRGRLLTADFRLGG